MKHEKLKAQIFAIGGKLLLFFVLAVLVITNTGAAESSGGACGGFNCCDCGSGSSGGGGGGQTTTTVAAGLPVTMSFMASVDSINDWNGPLTFTVNGVTYNSVDQEIPGTSLETVTVTYVSGGPPGAAFTHFWYGTNEDSNPSSGATATFKLGSDDYYIVFSFEHGNIAVSAALDGKPWTGSINYLLQGPDAATGSSVPQSYTNRQTGSYTLKYLSGGPLKAKFTGITPADKQTISGGGFNTFTFNFKSLNTLDVAATLDGNSWEGAVNYNINGASSLAGAKVNQSFNDVAPGSYSLSYVSGGPANSILMQISPVSLDIASIGNAIFTLDFTSTGDIKVNGILDDAAWTGLFNYTLTGPMTLTGTSLQQVFYSVPVGEYTLTYNSGGPAGANLVGISLSAIQPVVRGSQTEYTLVFASRGSITVTGSQYTSAWKGTCSYKITGDTSDGPVSLSGTEVPYTFTDLPLGRYVIKYLSGGPEGYEYYDVKPSNTIEITSAAQNVKANIRFIMPQSAVVPVITRADLSLTMIALDVGAGTNSRYTVTVTNSGPDTATGVQVTVSRNYAGAGGFNIAYLSDTPSQGAYNSATGVWTVGDIASGATVTLIINVTTDPGASVINSYTNTAEISACGTTDPDSTPNNAAPAEDDQATDTLNIV